MKNKKGIFMKVELYIMSLWLLFLLIFLLTVDISFTLAKNSYFIGFVPLIKRNIIAIISLGLLLYGLILSKKFQYRWRGVVQPSVKVLKAKNQNYEYLTFLTTYIIPLVCIDLSNARYLVVLVILLIIIGFIFVKMDFYLGNPTLALMGYRLYSITLEDSELPTEITVISKDIIKNSDFIEWIDMDKNSWFVRRSTK